MLVVTWAPGDNLPPMLAVASLLGRRGHEGRVLASGETHDAAERLGFEASGYRRSPDPDTRIAFAAQVDPMMATMAGAEIALDAREVLDELRPDLAVVDCMLPAATQAGRAREVRFHDLRHSFGTRMAGVGVPMRTLQEWHGHRDFATTLIYADYSPSEQEREWVEAAFARGRLVPPAVPRAEIRGSPTSDESPA